MFSALKVMEELKERRPVFVSEADFQLEFAWLVKELYGNEYSIKLEYTPSDEQLNKMHIDILLRASKDKRWIPIELKYKTKGCTINVEDDKFVLANHAAKDIGCYLYLNDIRRMEWVKTVKGDKYERGYAIMLTNDMSYTKKPRKDDCVYSDFSIHDGSVKCGSMEWGAAASEGTKKGIEKPIVLNGRYNIEWKNYKNLIDDKGKLIEFKYTVAEII